jgi:hypothetical protein
MMTAGVKFMKLGEEQPEGCFSKALDSDTDCDTDETDAESFGNDATYQVNAGAYRVQKRKAEERKFARPKTVRFADVTPVVEEAESSGSLRQQVPENSTNTSTEDEEMDDVVTTTVLNPGGKKKETPEQKHGRTKAPTEKLSTIIRNAGDATAVRDQILATPVTLPIGRLLATSSQVHRAFFSAIPVRTSESGGESTKKTADISAKVLGQRLISEPQSVPTEPEDPVYATQVLRAKVRISDTVVRAVIDTGSELNVITKALAGELNLQITPNHMFR